MAKQSLFLEMSYLIKCLSLQQLIPRITYPPPPHKHMRAHMRAHIQGEHSKLELDGQTVENIKTASAKKAGLQAHIQTQNLPTKT